jgi:hypothetical protein
LTYKAKPRNKNNLIYKKSQIKYISTKHVISSVLYTLDPAQIHSFVEASHASQG